MKSLITVTCPSCSHVVEIEAELPLEQRSLALKCPECHTPLEADLASASFACPGCRESLGADDVLCIHCGTDLRTGKRVGDSADGEEPAGLAPKRNAFPRLAVTVAAVAGLVAAGTVAILHSLDEARLAGTAPVAATSEPQRVVPVSNAVSEAAPVQSLPPPQATPPAAARIPGPGPIPPAWAQVSSTLFSLQGQTNVQQSLGGIQAALSSLGTTNNEIAIRLAAIYALGQKIAGHPDADKGVGYLQAAFPSSEPVQGLAPTNFVEACAVCKGNGRIATACLACGKTGRCSACSAQPKGSACSPCQGSGRCPKCAGKGGFVNTCSTCGGERGAPSPLLMQTSFKSSVAACAESILIMRQRRALPPLLTTDGPGEWTSFFSLYSARPAAPQPSAQEVAPLQASAQNACLFDAIVEFCRRSGTGISVDPEAVDALQHCAVDLSTFQALTNLETMARHIQANGMVLRQAPIHSRQTVPFITTQPTWAYALGCWYIQNNQPDKAVQLLESCALDQSSFSQHARSLAGVLKTIAEDSRALDETARTVRAALAEYAAARKDVEAIATGTRTLRRSGRPDEREVAAALRLEKAEANLRRASPMVDRFMGRVEHSLSTIAQRFVMAETCTLRSESLFLLDYGLRTFGSLKALVAEIEKAGLDAGELKNETVPDEVRDLRAQIADITRVAASLIAPPSANTSNDAARILVQYRRAFALDRANLNARVGAGYCTVQHHIRSLNSVLYEVHPTDEGLRALAEEFARARKNSYVAACARVGGASIRPPQQTEPAGSRTATGLAVVLEEGEALRLSVHFRPAAAQPPAPAARRGYWNAYNQALLGELASVPVTFGDYGAKDLFMRLSAAQVYKWLAYTYPAEMAGQGMHVEFHDLLLAKAGDSAGVTMGIAGYAALRRTDVRRDVAFTGSIRADGSVHPVGAVSAKIAGTLQVEAVELVIVPKENDSDLLLVPLDQLCRIVIVTSDNMQTYVKHATGEGYRREILDEVRQAQVLLLAGRRNECRAILAPIARKHPDIYTARRLLDIISFHEQTAELTTAAASGGIR